MTLAINSLSTLDSYQALSAGQAAAAGETGLEQKDTVALGSEKSPGTKILEFPKTVAKWVVGSAFAAGSAAIHTPPAVAEGMAEGLSLDFEHIDKGWFYGVTFSQFALGGAAAGFSMAGPAGAAVGAGAGAALGLVTLSIEEKAGFPSRFVGKVETAVDEVVRQNTASSAIALATKNMTQGALVGGVTGFNESLREGYDAGHGVVEAVSDVAVGVAQALRDVFKNRK